MQRGRPQGSLGKKDKPLDMNIEMYENTRNRMMGSSKIVRLMRLWDGAVKIQQAKRSTETNAR
jgi:hypothetical protein